MGAVWMWLRPELALRWKAFAGVVLVLGLCGGVALGAAAGARRTSTAYERMLADRNAADAAILDDGALGIDIPLDKVVALPQVDSYARASLVMFLQNQYAAIASVDDRLGRSINRLEVVQGRMYDSSRVEEVVVGLGVARVLGLHVGSVFPLVEPEFEDDLATTGLRNTMLKVVGIVSGPGDFPPQYVGLYPSIHLTPALFRVYGNRLASGDGSPERGSLFIKLRNGAADVPAFRSALEAMVPGEPLIATTQEEVGFGTERSFGFQATGLWFLAAFAMVAAILVGGQAIARQAFLGSLDFPTLGALGFSHGGFMWVGVLRAAVVGLSSAVIAVVLAIALSPLTPVGDARIAEPDPGVRLDVPVLAVGAAGLALLSIVLAVMPTWRASRRGLTRQDVTPALRPSRIAGFFARVSMPPSSVAGARLAFQAGRGNAALPVRSTIAGAAFGLAVLIAATTFGASLNNLIATPTLYGRAWDAFLTHYGEGPDLRSDTAGFLRTPGLADVTIATDLPLEIGGRPVFAFGVKVLRGSAGPPIVEGRAPRTVNEIALTSRTARRLGVRFGERVSARIPVGEAEPAEYTVVGHTVIPPFGFANAEPGEGAVLTLDGAIRLIPEGIELRGLVSDAMVRFAPGADRKKVVDALASRFGRSPEEFGEGPSETPADVVSFGQVRNLPIALGAILGLVAAATLAYTIASSVRRRRRDLAILKTLGFEKRQVRATVAWHATALVTAAVCVAVPAGVILGRWAWRLLADQISVVPSAVVPGWLVTVVAAASILAANAIATIPGRAASRLHAAAILRTE